MIKFPNTLLVFGLAAVLIGGACTVTAEKAGYYRWTDDEGNIQYTQLPPVGRSSEFVATRTGKVSSVDSEQPAGDEATVSDSTTEDNTLPDRMDILPQKDPERCKQGQDMIRATNNKSKRFRVIDENGEARLLSPEEIEEQRGRAQEMIDLHC